MVFKPGQRTNPIARLSVTGVYDDMLAEFASRELSPAARCAIAGAGGAYAVTRRAGEIVEHVPADSRPASGAPGEAYSAAAA
jgi:hypothetical protein